MVHCDGRSWSIVETALVSRIVPASIGIYLAFAVMSPQSVLFSILASTIDHDLPSVCNYKDSAGAKVHRYSPECRAAVEVVRFGVYDVTIPAPHRNPSCCLLNYFGPFGNRKRNNTEKMKNENWAIINIRVSDRNEVIMKNRGNSLFYVSYQIQIDKITNWKNSIDTSCILSPNEKHHCQK